MGIGISHVPSGDFSLYDHVLDTTCMFGAIPAGYGWLDGPVSLASYFALARGSRGTPAEHAAGIAPGLPALEMTKWFDTNYHYLVPRLTRDQRFVLTDNRPLMRFREAGALSLRTRPVLLGPVSFLTLSKTEDGSDPLDLLARLLPVYARLLRELAEANTAWVQFDEPVLALDLLGESKGGTRAGIRHPAPRSDARHPARQLFRSARRQPRHGGRAAGRRPACRSGARSGRAGCRPGRSAGGTLAVAGSDRRAQHMACRPARVAWRAGAGGLEARRSAFDGSAIVQPAARAGRSRRRRAGSIPR